MGFCPHDLMLYRQCFTHRSSSHVKEYGCNERLEFLGDAILDCVIADYLYKTYPQEQEGPLSELRARIVSRKTMNAIGSEMKLQQHMLARIPRMRQTDVIGNCLEALIGAIYKDMGYKKAREFILKKFLTPNFTIKKLPQDTQNYKNALLQYCQHKKISMEFRTNAVENESKKPLFQSEVVIQEKSISTAQGKSKKEAEQKASQKALKILHAQKK